MVGEMVSGEVEAKVRGSLQLVERKLIRLCQASVGGETDTKVIVDEEMGTRAIVGEETGTRVIVDEETGMKVIVDEEKGMKVLVDEETGMQVIVDEEMDTKVTVYKGVTRTRNTTQRYPHPRAPSPGRKARAETKEHSKTIQMVHFQ